MPYAPKTWTDRVVEKPMTYTVTNNPDGSITLTPAEGTVITAGDLVKAEYLNAMEQGIKSAHDDIALKAPLASPTFTGTPTAPSATGATDTTQIATMAAVHDAIDADVGVANSADVKTALNASGTAPIYACRAWVNFNGTGTVAIRSSGNVSSITDNGVGDYTIIFSTAMVDANYAVLATAGRDLAGTAPRIASAVTETQATTSVRIRSGGTGLEDQLGINVCIFR